MKVAKPADWKTEYLPAKHTTVSLNRRFTPDEMRRIKRGLIPEQMEDKWFIFFDQDILHFYRSWTGFCIYKAYFQKVSKWFRILLTFCFSTSRQPFQGYLEIMNKTYSWNGAKLVGQCSVSIQDNKFPNFDIRDHRK